MRDTILLPPIYSRRKRQAEATGQDVYNYYELPTRVRVQVIQMLEAGLGSVGPLTIRETSRINPCYDHIVKSIRRELGVLVSTPYGNLQQELFAWLLQETNIEHWLDVVEFSLQTMKALMSEGEYRSVYRPTAKPDDVIAEFNARLLEAAVGYQYVSGEIIRIDSQHLHSEVVLPVLHLLNAASRTIPTAFIREQLST